MSVLYKSQITRPSLDDLFFFESMVLRDLSIFFTHPINDKVDIGVSGCISYTIEEIISWDEIFLRKEELRPDLKYQIRSNNLSKDDMVGIGPKFNPFSLTYTELFEYNSWEDAMLGYHNMFHDGIAFEIIDKLKQSNNNFVQEHYINGIKVDDWIPKIKV